MQLFQNTPSYSRIYVFRLQPFLAAYRYWNIPRNIILSKITDKLNAKKPSKSGINVDLLPLAIVVPVIFVRTLL